MGYVTSSEQLDFGVDPHHDADGIRGFLKGFFYSCNTGTIVRILLITREVVDEFCDFLSQ